MLLTRLGGHPKSGWISQGESNLVIVELGADFGDCFVLARGDLLRVVGEKQKLVSIHGQCLLGSERLKYRCSLSVV